MQSFGKIVPASSIRGLVSESEWKVRLELAACYRLMHMYGMTDLVYNHISARVPGHATHFLVNLYGLRYDEICASNLVKVDLEGNEVLKIESPYSVNPAGFIIHSAIHEARHDVMCVIHTHTRAGMAVAALRAGLLPLSIHALRFTNNVAYHAFEGLAIDPTERARLQRDIGEKQVLILRNHGLLITGDSIAETFNATYFLEQACKVQMDAMAAGSDLIHPPPEVLEHTSVQYRPERRRFGVLEWPALLRLVERDQPDYKD